MTNIKRNLKESEPLEDLSKELKKYGWDIYLYDHKTLSDVFYMRSDGEIIKETNPRNFSRMLDLLKSEEAEVLTRQSEKDNQLHPSLIRDLFEKGFSSENVGALLSRVDYGGVSKGVKLFELEKGLAAYHTVMKSLIPEKNMESKPTNYIKLDLENGNSYCDELTESFIDTMNHEKVKELFETDFKNSDNVDVEDALVYLTILHQYAGNSLDDIIDYAIENPEAAMPVFSHGVTLIRTYLPQDNILDREMKKYVDKL